MTSTSTAVARPTPVILITGSGSVAKPRNTATMTPPAAVMIRRVRAVAVAITVPVVGVPAPLLADAREQEHVVVRREPEEDREHEQRHIGDDGQLLDAEQARAGRGLERERDDAVGRRDRGEVERRGEQRHPPGAEGGQQEQQRHADHRRGEQRVRLAMRSASSPKRAVRPPTYASAPISGITSARSRSTSSRVASSCGPSFGRDGDHGRVAGLVAHRRRPPTRLGSAAMPRSSWLQPTPPDGSATATTSGPLTPGPKPAASRS